MSETPSGLETGASNSTNVVNDTPPILPHLQQQHIQQESSKINYEEEAQKLEDKALIFLSKQARPVFVPPFAAWFKMDQIHEIEKRSMPDFFDDSSRFKTLKVYKDSRNFMINAYRLSPYEYLTMTAVRRNIAMDVASIYKIHKFLETWGLINYQVDPRSKPSLVGPSFTGHFQTILDTPQGLKPDLPGENQDIENNKSTVQKSDLNINDNEKHLDLSLRKNVYDSSADYNVFQTHEKSSTQIQKSYICHVCTTTTVEVHYHNLRARDANLCSECYQNGHFGNKFTDSDYIKTENYNRIIGNSTWSDQEVVLLLEAIEMYHESWDQIVAHIGGTKNKEQCVEKYLSLPINPIELKKVLLNVKSHSNTKEVSVKEEQESNKMVELTINHLSQALNFPEDDSAIDKTAILETQQAVKRITDLTVEKLNKRLDQIRQLELVLRKSKEAYLKSAEGLSNDRIMLSKQITEINKDLPKFNITKRIDIQSQPITKIQLKESTEIVDVNAKSQLQKSSPKIAEAVSQTNSDLYQPLLL